jgi:hypothetical protein
MVMAVCFPARVGELSDGLVRTTPDAPDYASAIAEIFDKGLICS